MSIIKKIIKNQSNTDIRSKTAIVNIIYSIGIKGVSVLTYFLLVPVTLSMLNPVEYGIWLTISSMLMWINTFDIGLTNGLKNKLSEALAINDKIKARAYITTTYVILTVLVTLIFIVFLSIFEIINWYDLFNTNDKMVPQLKEVILYSFSIVCFSFVFKTIGSIYQALQKSAIENLLIMLGNVLSLLLIYILSFFDKGNLFLISIIYTISPLIVFVIAHPLFFLGKKKFLKPKIKYFDKKYIKDLMGLGLDFFILQIGGLLIFSTSNILITKLLGAENVTIYNIAYRYFSVIPLLFSIILTPIWVATNEAFVKNDIKWIKNSISKLNRIIFLSGILIILMIILSDFFYNIWVGDSVKVSKQLTILMAIYTYIIAISLCYSTFINGIGKLRIQVFNTIFVAISFIPIAYYLSLSYGIYGITFALILVNITGVILNILQFYKIINLKAHGIWNK